MSELSKLERVAAMAMQGMMSKPHGWNGHDVNGSAKAAVRAARAILAECAKNECSVCRGKGTLDCGDPAAVDPPCFACSTEHSSRDWIPHTPGDPAPDYDGAVFVRLRDGRELGATHVHFRHWDNQENPSDIIAWKPA